MASPPIERSRRLGLAAGAAGIGAALAVLLPLRDDVDAATAALVLLLPGIAAAVVGDRLTAGLVAVAAGIAYNLGFVTPLGSFAVGRAAGAVDVAVFVAVALVTATLVARADERREAAERRAVEVEEARAEQQRLEAEALALALAGEHRAALLRAVSHDLRTPLSTIRAVASDLREGGVAYDDPTRDELLDLVVDESERLDRLVANLLSLSRVEAGALEADRQAIDLGELLERLVVRHRRLVRDRKVSVDVPLALPFADADWTLVEQAVTNLVANAVRHAPEGTRIWVSARRGEPGWVEVAVRDQGPGVPAELRRAVFEPFRSGPGSTSSGVGLAIVRAVVDAHGGTVVVDEPVGGGTEVRFTLPAHHG